jgi:hypothetical protein
MNTPIVHNRLVGTMPALSPNDRAVLSLQVSI